MKLKGVNEVKSEEDIKNDSVGEADLVKLGEEVCVSVWEGDVEVVFEGVLDTLPLMEDEADRLGELLPLMEDEVLGVFVEVIDDVILSVGVTDLLLV